MVEPPHVKIPLSTLLCMSGSVCDWDWYPRPGAIDLEVLRNVEHALADGLDVLLEDSARYARVATYNLPSMHSRSTKAGPAIPCMDRNAPC